MKYLANWKVRHDKKTYLKGEEIEGVELPESVVKIGAVTIIDGEPSKPIVNGDKNGDGTPLTNQKEGVPFIESCEDVAELEKLLVVEKKVPSKSRKWALAGLEARIAVLGAKAKAEGNDDDEDKKDDESNEA